MLPKPGSIDGCGWRVLPTTHNILIFEENIKHITS
jgi:hypothetical protein